MNILHQILEALRGLSSNKLRSALTVLGIVIGVAAVIAMLAIGRGAQNSISGSIESIGTNLIYIYSGNANVENLTNPKPLTLSDAIALADPASAPSVLRTAPVIQGRGDVSYSGESTNTSILGVTSDFSTVTNLKASEGELISDNQYTSRAAVAVIGIDVANSLFGRAENVVGETVRIEGQPFRVIGVLESKGGSGFGSQDDRVLIPLTTAQSRLLKRSGLGQIDTIYVQAIDANSVSEAVEEVTQILADRHHTETGREDFSVLNQQDILSIAQSITSVLTIFLGGIAAISLLVGGIGIMNIMYVSVTERTREIGLRKAVGARKLDIMIQFLVESSILSLIGGMIGILLAWGIASVVGQIAMANSVDINPKIELDMVLLATFFSAGVGMFFGFYPSLRAANLQPVEALRSE
jgi:putative ABC transport system permease protein